MAIKVNIVSVVGRRTGHGNFKKKPEEAEEDQSKDTLSSIPKELSAIDSDKSIVELSVGR